MSWTIVTCGYIYGDRSLLTGILSYSEAYADWVSLRHDATNDPVTGDLTADASVYVGANLGVGTTNPYALLAIEFLGANQHGTKLIYVYTSDTNGWSKEKIGIRYT